MTLHKRPKPFPELSAACSVLDPSYIRAPAEHDHSDVQQTKRLAARVGRTLGNAATYARARQRLYAHLWRLPPDRLRFWARCPILDLRWSGATGRGGYWAHATVTVNEEARRILLSDRYRDLHNLAPLFQVI